MVRGAVQLEEFEQLSQVVEESVASTATDVEVLKQEFGVFTESVVSKTETVSSLIRRILATPEDNYDAVLAGACVP